MAAIRESLQECIRDEVMLCLRPAGCVMYSTLHKACAGLASSDTVSRVIASMAQDGLVLRGRWDGPYWSVALPGVRPPWVSVLDRVIAALAGVGAGVDVPSRQLALLVGVDAHTLRDAVRGSRGRVIVPREGYCMLPAGPVESDGRVAVYRGAHGTRRVVFGARWRPTPALRPATYAAGRATAAWDCAYIGC